MANHLLLSSTPSSHHHHLFLRNKNPRIPHPLSIAFPLKLSTRPSLTISASLLSPPPPPLTATTTSTHTITSLLISSASSLSRSLTTPSTSPLFFVQLPRDFHTKLMLTLTHAMLLWLDFYMVLLLVMVLLSWIPFFNWDREPLATIRDLCDPFKLLRFFRKYLPPVFGVLDLSPFLVLCVYLALNLVLVDVYRFLL